VGDCTFSGRRQSAGCRYASTHRPRALAANRSADLSSLSQTQFELGNVLAQQGDIAQAVHFYHLALETANQAQFDDAVEQRILALNNLAYHLHLLDDPTARRYAQAGLELAQEKGVLGLQTYLYSTLGEISLAADDLVEAEDYFQEGSGAGTALFCSRASSRPDRQSGFIGRPAGRNHSGDPSPVQMHWERPMPWVRATWQRRCACGWRRCCRPTRLVRFWPRHVSSLRKAGASG